MMKRFLPLGIDLVGAGCVVVGGGRIGTRKVRTLLDAGARVTVIAPVVTPELAELRDQGAIRWIAAPFVASRLGDPLLVVAATPDADVNRAVVEAARERQALVCDASAAERSQVIFGALHRSADMTVAVFTNGHDPARARRTRDQLARHVAAASAAAGGAAGAPGPAGRLIVIAHGSRDARWRASMEAVIEELQREVGEENLALAYMDRAPPTLLDAVQAAAAEGCRRVRVLPLFLAPEGHVEKDIRPVVELARSLHPELELDFLPPIGQLAGFRRLLRELVVDPGEPDG